MYRVKSYHLLWIAMNSQNKVVTQFVCRKLIASRQPLILHRKTCACDRAQPVVCARSPQTRSHIHWRLIRGRHALPFGTKLRLDCRFCRAKFFAIVMQCRCRNIPINLRKLTCAWQRNHGAYAPLHRRWHPTACVARHSRANRSPNHKPFQAKPLTRFWNINFTLSFRRQVHTRITYLRHLIVSLAQSKDISRTLLIFSHDYYDEDINDLVQTIDFCKVLQVTFRRWARRTLTATSLVPAEFHQHRKLFVKIVSLVPCRYSIRIRYKRTSTNFRAKIQATVLGTLNETSECFQPEKKTFASVVELRSLDPVHSVAQFQTNFSSIPLQSHSTKMQ